MDEPGSPSKGGGGDESNIKVMVRVRPFNKREIEISESKNQALQSIIRMRDKTCVVMEFGTDEKGYSTEKEREACQFDECFWSLPMEQSVSSQPFADQKYVYERSGLHGLEAGFDGYNVAIFAYGQTGSGKTHSMLGTEEDPGISLRLTDDLFDRIKSMETTMPHIKVIVECTFFEIYNEKVRDLFHKKATEAPPKIRQHPTKGVFVDGLLRKEVKEAKPTKHLIDSGTKARAAAETKMNSRSSRSHAVFQIQIIQNDVMKGTQRVSTINLVDLAGSERIKLSQVTGQQLTEAKNINQSLSTLRRVIDVLIDNSAKKKSQQTLPPFRDSVLTYVLSDSLGGNSKTMMIATVSPHESNAEDTLGTLRYALRAKAIVCKPKVNEEESRAMMDAMKDEIAALQARLRSGGPGGAAGNRAAANAEILKEIELREAEVKRMEEAKTEAEVRLHEVEAMKAEAEEKLKHADEMKAELDLTLQQQKRERFAAAFRNAFIITTEKKKQESTKAEADTFLKENTELKRNNAFLEQELSGLRTSYDELSRRTNEQIEEFIGSIAQRDQDIIRLKRQVANNMEENRHLTMERDTLSSKLQAAEEAKLDVERRIQRIQEELLATSAAVEREKADKARLQGKFDQKTKEFTDEIDNLRRRKDKYKQQYMEINAKASAHKTIIDNMQSDRAAYLATLQAQQQVVSEQAQTASRLIGDKRETEQKLSTLERKLDVQQSEALNLSEALREYQAASAEWMYENHAKSRELERVSKGFNDLRGISDAASFGSPTVSGTYSPRPARPSAGRASVHVDPAARTGGSTPRGASAVAYGSPARSAY